MPPRTIRDTILDSEAVNSLPDSVQCFYLRLHLIADDAGRFDGRPEMVNSRAYPITPRPIKDIKTYLDQTENAGLILRYSVAGKRYLQITKWRKCSNAVVSRWPWRDGSYHIAFALRETPQGPKQYVSSSLLEENPTDANLETRGPVALRRGKYVAVKNYGDHVLLTDMEHDGLIRQWGQRYTDHAIAEYNERYPNSAAMKRHVDHCAALKLYCRKKWLCKDITPKKERPKTRPEPVPVEDRADQKTIDEFLASTKRIGKAV